jgi:DNA-binding protein H-NS
MRAAHCQKQLQQQRQQERHQQQQQQQQQQARAQAQVCIANSINTLTYTIDSTLLKHLHTLERLSSKFYALL